MTTQLMIRELARVSVELERLQRNERMGELILGIIIAVFVSIGVVILFLPVALYNTYVISCLWGWFIEPVFHIPVPLFGYMYGIMLFVGMFHRHSSSSPTEKKKSYEILIELFVPPSAALGMGALVHHFM